MTGPRAADINKVRRDAAADKARVRRTFSMTLDSSVGAKQRADGSWEFDGVATRGDAVFDYSYEMGKPWREYRPLDEVFAPLSIESLIGAAITDDHPAEFVDIFNAREHERGHVMKAWQDGKLMRVRVLVRDADLLRKIFELGKIELSCGYSARNEGDPGQHATEGPYETTQREIIHNHLAVVDAARAGPVARLSVPVLQGGEAGPAPGAPTGDRRAGGPPTARGHNKQKDAPVNELIVNGVKYVVSATATEVPQALAVLWAQMEQQLAEANKKIQELQAAQGAGATPAAAADPNAAAPAADPDPNEEQMGDKNKGDGKGKGATQAPAGESYTKEQVDALVREATTKATTDALAKLNKQQADADARGRIVADAQRVLPKGYAFEGKADADVLADALIQIDKSLEGTVKKLAKDGKTDMLHGMLVAKVDEVERMLARPNLLAAGALVRDAQNGDGRQTADAARDRYRDRKLGKTTNAAAAAGNGK